MKENGSSRKKTNTTGGRREKESFSTSWEKTEKKQGDRNGWRRERERERTVKARGEKF